MQIQIGTPITLCDEAFQPPRVTHGIIRGFCAGTAVVEFIDGPLTNIRLEQAD